MSFGPGSGYVAWLNPDNRAIGELIQPYGSNIPYVTANITTNAAVDLIPASTASPPGKQNITSLLVTNGHATVGSYVKIVDETTGDILWRGYAAPAGGGFNGYFGKVPLKQRTAGKKVQVIVETTESEVCVSCMSFESQS